jgi:hypothetical protein
MYWGISDANFYESLRGKPTQEMKVTDIRSVPNSRGFSVPHVLGETSKGEISFPISAKAARRIEPGQSLPIVETEKASEPYMTRESLDQQLSEIIFSTAGLSFNFIAILGSVLALGALGWGLFGKSKQVI